MSNEAAWSAFWSEVKAAFGNCPEYAQTCMNCRPGIEDRIEIRRVFERAVDAAITAERTRCAAIARRRWLEQTAEEIEREP